MSGRVVDVVPANEKKITLNGLPVRARAREVALSMRYQAGIERERER